MNRKILTSTILAFAFGLVVSCSDDNGSAMINELYVNIPDAVFEKVLVDQGIDTDGIVDQKVLRSDAEKVTVLNIDFSADYGEISDLTGIEGFVNLTRLSAVSQAIEKIDLSNNTLLDTLYLSGNLISSIDLSHNTNLILVDIQSNDFRSADSIVGLSNATNLKDLDISWNYLEEFSIHNESLEVLHISHNDLKTLDTDGAMKLRNIFMPSNQLESVDFSTNISLETLLVSDNKIQEINLENNPNLTHLYISSNLLTSLDVSYNQSLYDLRVDRNSNLTCIKIQSGQDIPSVMLSDYQEVSSNCD
jgi:Leucine-rich repeat (LRR) protein